MFGPRGLLAVFPSLFSFYERIGMDDEHKQRHANCTHIHVLMEQATKLLTCIRCYATMTHRHTDG